MISLTAFAASERICDGRDGDEDEDERSTELPVAFFFDLLMFDDGVDGVAGGVAILFALSIVSSSS